MKKFITMVIPAFLLVVGVQVSAAPECYKTIDDETKQAKSYVEIDPATGTGVIKKLLTDPTAKCTACEGALKDKPIQGMQIITGMKIGDKAGTILDPKKGKVYSLKVWKEGDDLKVRGYISIAYRTQTWKAAPGMCN
jgi:uncharacterized protein (DUF2147 family)